MVPVKREKKNAITESHLLKASRGGNLKRFSFPRYSAVKPCMNYKNSHRVATLSSIKTQIKKTQQCKGILLEVVFVSRPAPF